MFTEPPLANDAVVAIGAIVAVEVAVEVEVEVEVELEVADEVAAVAFGAIAICMAACALPNTVPAATLI